MISRYVLFMLTESFGGECPNCHYDRMLMRYGSFGYCFYDACPNCGFAFATNQIDDDDDFSEGDFWLSMVNIETNDVQKALNEILLEIESHEKTHEERKSVFVYDKNLKAIEA